MKKAFYLIASLAALNLVSAMAQPVPGLPLRAPVPMGVPGQPQVLTLSNAGQQAPLTQFSLDFPGGPPDLLVKAIEKATGKPLNVIIRPEDEQQELPPLKMNDVNIPQLFAALGQASRKSIAVVNSGFGNSYSTFVSGYGFETQPPVTDNSIWYFHVDKPTMPPVNSNDKDIRLYSLDIYLRRGFTVDDITTAIQTGWKMAGISNAPELNYHKETKLLIAYGDPRDLNLIGMVLQSLPNSNATPSLADEMNELKGRVKVLASQVDSLKKASVPAAQPGGAEKAGN